MELFKIGFLPVHPGDVLDITVVAFVLYGVHSLIRRSVLWQGMIMLSTLILLWIFSAGLRLNLLNAIVAELLKLSSIGLLIVFAPELRRSVLILRKTQFFEVLLSIFSSKGAEQILATDELIKGVYSLASKRVGALIVLMGDTDMSDIINTGDKINAELSERMLFTIFQTKSPLHDGAVLIKNNIIIAARCVLPTSDDPDLPPELGLRHRSAMGISEVSDALAIVVSEQTGQVSVGYNGRLKRNLSTEELLQFLTTYLRGDRNLLFI